MGTGGHGPEGTSGATFDLHMCLRSLSCTPRAAPGDFGEEEPSLGYRKPQIWELVPIT